MTVFCRLCLWLVMLALPVQGFAAASMLYCGPKAHAAQASQPADHEVTHGMSHAGHDHASHAQHASAHAPAHDAPDVGNEAHQCLMCAFCGHSVALSEFPKALEFGEPAHASPPEPSALIQPIAVLVPDKPPRV